MTVPLASYLRVIPKARPCLSNGLRNLFTSTTSRSSKFHEKPLLETDLSFIIHNPSYPKPRTKGLTEIRAAYYTVMGPNYLSDVLETMGHWVDGLKFAGGSHTLFPESKLREIIDLAHAHDVYVSTGGYYPSPSPFPPSLDQ
jgi:hypothetical protein